MYRPGRPRRQTVPLNLIVDARPAAVFGGGRVGLRKVRGLLDAGAAVTLVCPACVPELEALAAEGRIRRLKRRFRPGDAAGKLLVFACTDDKHVNRAILEDARRSRVPCCCADMNWADADFTTPATGRVGDVTVSVSTGGQNCTAARRVRDDVLAHLNEGRELELFVVGTDDGLLPSARRAALHLPPAARIRFGAWAAQVKGVREFAVLNTCSRVEIVLVASGEPAVDAVERLAGLDRLAAGERLRLRGFEAFRHLVRVASGLESAFLGEFHVAHQVKAAFAEAAERGWGGPALAYAAAETLRVSKAVRAAVGGRIRVEEVDQVAVRHLLRRGVAAGSRVAVVGTGAVGTGVAESLAKAGARVDWIWHRNRPASAPAGARLVPFARRAAAYARADAVVAAADAENPVVGAAQAGRFAGRKVLLLDLGVPRNVDPALDGLGGGVEVVDLDALKRWQRARGGALAEIRAACDRVIHAEWRGIV